MKRLEKIELIDIIARELQKRMKFFEINGYFETYGIPIGHESSYNSKYVYVKEVLPKVNDNIIIEIATELGINHPALSKVPFIKEGDANFWKAGHFKLFISHLASFKIKISVLKTELEKYGISAFVAHEDIEPTKEWQDEIEKGLFSMDALCAVLMPGFKESNWTDQEVGVAIGRGVLIIPVRKGLDPYGFIGKYQGFQATGKSVGEVTQAIFKIIANNPKTKTQYLQILLELIVLSSTTIQAISRFEILKQVPDISKDDLEFLRVRITDNTNLKNTVFLAKFNALASKFNLPEVTLEAFEKTKEFDLDDLPF